MSCCYRCACAPSRIYKCKYFVSSCYIC